MQCHGHGTTVPGGRDWVPRMPVSASGAHCDRRSRAANEIAPSYRCISTHLAETSRSISRHLSFHPQKQRASTPQALTAGTPAAAAAAAEPASLGRRRAAARTGTRAIDSDSWPGHDRRAVAFDERIRPTIMRGGRPIIHDPSCTHAKSPRGGGGGVGGGWVRITVMS